jgi:hypothetical protein
MEGVDGVVISLPVTGGDLIHSVADLMHSHVAFLAEQDLIIYIHSTVVADGAVLILERREKGERIRVKATRNNTDATPLYSSVIADTTLLYCVTHTVLTHIHIIHKVKILQHTRTSIRTHTCTHSGRLIATFHTTPQPLPPQCY